MHCRTPARPAGPVISFAVLHLGASIRANLVGAPREGAPELPAHEADERGALVQPVVARHHVEHLEVARRGREGADLGFDLRHIQLLYKTCIPGQAAFRSAGGGSCLRQRPIQRAVSFSCAPFCARRCASAPKSTWSSGWSWLKHQKTELVLPVARSTCGVSDCAQVAFIIHCHG